MQLATNQGVVLPPRSSAAKNVLAQVGVCACVCYGLFSSACSSPHLLGTARCAACALMLYEQQSCYRSSRWGGAWSRGVQGCFVQQASRAPDLTGPMLCHGVP